LRLKELNEKRASGELRRGRPTVEGSARQARIAELEQKRANGELKKGRPVNPNSAKQMKLAEIAAKKASGEFKLGRPKVNKVVSVGNDEMVELASIEG
jgi:hypothetical protein